MQMDVDDGDVSGWDENDMDVDDFVGVKHRRSNMISPSVSMMDVDVGRARNLLTSQWNDIAQASGAAEITIVNEVDDEAIPPIPEGFVYVESGYTYPPELKPPEIIDDLFLRCDCASCMDASSCECQDLVSVMDSLGRKIYAYHKNGFYNFEYPQGSIVVECNKFCKCPTNHCRNRVAQKPRDIPIQVFKTLGRGWGVCSTTLIRKGKVLGMYGGTIITRAHAESLDEEAKSYCFDLDGQEMMNEGPTDNSESYSVDGRTCGNWTRFLNHSCSPNLQAYQVVYDTIPEMNRPYIAFAALRQIDPREELTIDYDPAGAIQPTANRKSKAPSGATPCRCASKKCRGWVKSIS
ncbi:SET domain-containing protein [Pluteus cervinus]|uniref:SET domain-containing protein n=1 Tax=Pluteus cervinus TaxID=181527 RepID=A0ACD3ACI7_9AGAR|nr:SET domain-containing protein [Pluteus cervinus]